jgi:predicted amidohydrolase
LRFSGMPGRAMLGPMSRLSVLGVQLDCVWEDKAANFKKVEALLEAQPPAPGALLVLPEMFATGFSCDLNQTAEPHGAEPTLAFLRGLAARWQCAVLGGLVVRGEDGLARNQALALAPDGRELARYSKMRPFSAGGEAAVHARGESPVLFEWGGLRIAPLICYDLRFPEIARAAVAQGAQLLVYQAAWPVKRWQHWLTLLQARAIENQAAVLGVNRTGSDPNFLYNGRSVLVSAHGIITADAGEQESLLRGEVDGSALRQWRRDFPALADAGLPFED